MKSKVLIAIVAGILLAGGIGYAAAWYLRPAHDEAIQLVPNDAAAYANVFLDPSGRQQLALRDLLGKFPSDVGSPDKARQAVEKVFTQMLDPTGLAFKTDVEPWLGREIAGWAGPLPSQQMSPFGVSSMSSSNSAPQGTAALLMSTTDGNASMDAVHQAEDKVGGNVAHDSYKGFDFDSIDGSAVGIVDNFLVIGTRSGFENTVDAATGDTPSLDSSNTFKTATSKLHSDRLALFYIDSHQLTSHMPTMFGSVFGLSGQPDSKGASAAVVYARSNGLVVEAAGPATSDLDYSKASDLLKSLPNGSWAALADPGFGTRLRELYANVQKSFGMNGDLLNQQFRQQTGLDLQQDVLSWMGSLSVFAEGTSLTDLGVGATISTSDPKTTQHMLDRLAQLVSKTAAVKAIGGAPSAYGVTDPTNPRAHYYFGAGSRGFQVAYGAQAWADVRGASSTLQEDQSFKDAEAGLGKGFQPTFYINVSKGLQLAESLGLSSDQDYMTKVRPKLQPIEYMIFGSGRSDGQVISRFVIGVS